MALFVIDAVQINAHNNRIEKVRWGKVRGGEVGPPAWATTPSIADVSMVVDAINNGDEVMTLFTTGDGVVFGPKVQVIDYGDGSQGIETGKSDISEKRLRDLPAIQ